MKFALLFPGQGSQFVGMGKDLALSNPDANDIFKEADEILGFRLSKLTWEGPEYKLNDTINTQPALLVHSVAALRIFQNQYTDIDPHFVAGHSMGELSALVAAKALSFPDALKLVRRRGELMKRAGEQSPGSMAAILGLDIEVLERICLEASNEGEVVQVANDNCPGQVVISGASAAMERALERAQHMKARRIIPLAVSIAAHSPLMLTAQEDFNLAVVSFPISSPTIPIVGNVGATPLTTANQIRDDLKAQLTSRVRWTESIQYMLSAGIETFIELGSGSVLTGLVRRIQRDAQVFSLGTPDEFLNFQPT